MGEFLGEYIGDVVWVENNDDRELEDDHLTLYFANVDEYAYNEDDLRQMRDALNSLLGVLIFENIKVYGHNESWD